MPVLNEATHYPGEAIMSEANFHRSRDVAVVASGSGVFKPNQLLTRTGAGTASSAAKAGGNTGNATLALAGTPVLDGAKAGVYTVRMLTATTFRVEDPDGFVKGEGANTVAFADDIGFTITAGGTPMIAGDGFDITVNPTAGKWAKATATTKAEGIAIYGGDATSADVKVAVITRDAEVNGNMLAYDTTHDDATKKARAHSQLAEVGIIVR
jgi:hypothetical protein